MPSQRRWFTRAVRSPAFIVLLLAPYFGEGLSGSTPPIDLLLPWNLAFMAALYGCGALVCREVAHRFGLGWRGLVLLAVGYGIWEEALVDRYWFYPTFWHDSGIGTYSVVWHTNVLIAVHLTAFHATISIVSSVLVVEWLTPAHRGRAWVSRPALVAAGVVLALTPVIYGEFDQRPPLPVLAAAAGLLVLVVVAAFLVPRRKAGQPRPAAEAKTEQDACQGRRGIGILAFGCVLAHWIATYAVAETPLPWPVGVAVAMVPIVVGLVAVPRLALTGPYGADGVRVVAGLVAFFVALDLFVGLSGRYDLIVSALVTAYLIRRLHKNKTRPRPSTASTSP